jgi:predicted CopG family antitoxin
MPNTQRHRDTDAEQTISLNEETYARLDREKGEEERFSDVIDRLLGITDATHSLYGLVGLCEVRDVAALRERSRASRVDDRMGQGS